ncbi:MAG: FHA domain-containing protein [Deltaproteobacteria bacterium]|nr:FHA domain-containing protein [Deltaproteobacteria bacterium]
MGFSLLILDQDKNVRWHPLTPGTLRIGRGRDNDLVLSGRGVSRHHARLIFQDGILTAEDLDSTYGTRVSGELVRSCKVEVGESVDIGVFRIVLLPREAVSARSVGVEKPESGDFPPMETVELAVVGNKAASKVVMGQPTQVFEEEDVTDPGYASSLETSRALVNHVHFVDGWAQDALARVLRSGGQRAGGEDWSGRALSVLGDMARRLGSGRAVIRDLERSLDDLATVIPYDLAVVLEMTSDRAFEPIVVRYQGTRGDDIPLSRTVVVKAAREKAPVISENLASDPDFRATDSVHIKKVGALVALPMMLGEDVVGVLYISRAAGATFADQELKVAEVAASMGAAAVRQKRLRKQLDAEKRREVTLDRIVDPELRDRVEGQRPLFSLEEKECTVMVARGVVRFDQVSMDKVVSLFADLYGTIYDAVTTNGGHVVSVRNGTVVALFGLPGSSRTDAAWAATAGLDLMRRASRVIAPKWQHVVQLGVGLDTGRIWWGVLGIPGWAEQICLGETMDRAAALAGDFGGAGLFVSQATKEGLPGQGFDVTQVHVDDTRVASWGAIYSVASFQGGDRFRI